MPKETHLQRVLGFLIWFNLYNSSKQGKWFLFTFYKEETRAHRSNLPKVAWPGTAKAGTGTQILRWEPEPVPHIRVPPRQEQLIVIEDAIRVGTHCLPDKKRWRQTFPSSHLPSLPSFLPSFYHAVIKWLPYAQLSSSESIGYKR